MIKSRDMKISDTYDGEVWDMVLDVPAEKEVFISYSSKDFERVNRIKEILETNGISCWMAPQCIPAGSNYAREIPAAIKNCKVFLTALRRQYRENPNAEVTAQWISRYQIGAFQVEAVLGALERCGLFLPSAAEIAVQEAVIFIHSGDRKYIKRARRLLNTAVKIYLGQKAYDETAFKRIIYARWLIAVTYKQERNFGCANELCEDLIAYIEDENQVFGIPYSDSLLLPQRELLVINKEEVMSDYLTFHMEDIRMNPKELFYTQRRMLELHILNNDFEKARALLPELLQSFEKCRNYVDEIYHVGLYQNLFEYYSYVGDKEEAERYYRLALENARKNFWKGKEKKLSTLKQIFE